MKKKDIVVLLSFFVIIGVFIYFTIFGLTINDKTYIKSAKQIRTGLDISGGVAITYQATVEEGQVITTEELKKSETVIRKRLEAINIFDANVRLDESTNQILLEIPADITDTKKDPLEAVKGLDKTAKIEFVDEEGNVLVSGDDIASAKLSETAIDNTGIPTPHVVLTFSEEGRVKFKEATTKLVGKEMSVNLDGNKIFAPMVNEIIDSNTAIITVGGDSYAEKKEQATEYALLIDSGALPFTLDVIYKEYVGPFIGQQALEISVYAGIVAFILISIFMIVIYRLPGVVAAISLATYISLVIMILVVTGTSLTLSGIAGLILSIGMAVDANVIIFERLKDELKANVTYKKAFDRSFKTAMTAIVDGNVTTFIIALLLYILGIGAVKGFGLILAIGVLVSLFTAVFVTKTILKKLLPLSNKSKFLFGLKKEV